MLRRPFVWAAIGSLFLDQVTKMLIYGLFGGGLADSPGSVRILGDILRFVYERNQHGVFGLVYGPRVIYLILPIAGIALVIWLGLQTLSGWLATAYGLILGGALGNLVDRIRLGYVIDFIVVELPRLRFRWYTFNLADAFLVIGVIMLIGYELLRPREKARAAGKVGG